jgi:hypothetical protein
MDVSEAIVAVATIGVVLIAFAASLLPQCRGWA